MRRLIDHLSGVLAGMLYGILLAAALAPSAWEVVPASSPAPHVIPGPGTPGMTTERVSPLPSPRVEGLGGTPEPSPSPLAVPDVPPVRRWAAIRGAASWYCLPGRSACTAGHPAGELAAAAGPALRVGDWRGRVVTVTAGDRSVRVRLIDWCACPDGRVIDLYASAFRRLAPLERGLVTVEVRP